MYQLYYSPGAASLVVHWLLIEIGAPHELKLVDLEARQHKTPEYLKLNPTGLIPTLVIDGRPHYESGALVMALADRHPEAGLAPPIGSAARTAYYQWIVHLANALQPPFRHWFYPDEVLGPQYVDAVKAAARVRIETCYDHLDAHLAANGPYVCGEALSAADFFAAMMMRWSRNMPKPATEWPQLKAFAARMKARPSFKALYQREGLTEWA
jgi:glutathione S-transferase